MSFRFPVTTQEPVETVPGTKYQDTYIEGRTTNASGNASIVITPPAWKECELFYMELSLPNNSRSGGAARITVTGGVLTSTLVDITPLSSMTNKIVWEGSHKFGREQLKAITGQAIGAGANQAITFRARFRGA